VLLTFYVWKFLIPFDYDVKKVKGRILSPEDYFLAQLTEFYHEKGENAARVL